MEHDDDLYGGYDDTGGGRAVRPAAAAAVKRQP
jgi:hypothetical protein